MESAFHLQNLITIVNGIPVSINSVVLNAIFGRRFRPDNDMHDTYYEMRTGTEGISDPIEPEEPARTKTLTTRVKKYLSIPRLAETFQISPAQLKNLRAMGTDMGLETANGMIMTEMQDLRNKFDRTLEFWAVSALKGSVTKSDGTVIIDYSLPTSHRITLTGTAQWDADEADIPESIRTYQRLVEDDLPASGSGMYEAYCGWGVMNSILKNPKIRELLRYSRGAQIVEGRLGGELGRGPDGQATPARRSRAIVVENTLIEEYNGFYRNAAGTKRRFVKPSDFHMVQNDPQWFGQIWAPNFDLDDPMGVGSQNPGAAQPWFSKSWRVPNPSGQHVLIEGNMVPVVISPEAIIHLTPITAIDE